MRENIRQARSVLYHRSIFSALLEHVPTDEIEAGSDAAQFACVDVVQGVVWLNPRGREVIERDEWVFILAHELLHLGLNHAARRGDRDPLLWSLACDEAANSLLHAFKVGRAPRTVQIDDSWAGMREEEIYDRLTQNREVLSGYASFAGPGRLDMIRSGQPYKFPYSFSRRRKDFENLLAEGIRSAVESTVEAAAETLGSAAEQANPKLWRPGELARKWVLNELPLLGALAAQMPVIADAALCDRMGIDIAAINPWLGEIYFHPNRGLEQAEILFVYVHELLHAALLHHSRIQGRDPLIWNLACDFVINGWLVEMGVGKLPGIGCLYDPTLKGMSSEEVYDLIIADKRRCAGLRGSCKKRGDIILDGPGSPIYRGDVCTLDDIYRRAMATGLACPSRGLVPAGLLEEIRSLFTPPVPWDVELARWMDAHVPLLRDPRRSYARASRRQSSTPEIPRPARYIPQEWKESCTFGVIMDTSGSMDREMLGRALGAIASYAEARDVPAVRLVLCDATPYDRGIVQPADLRGTYPVIGRGGTVLQPAVNHLLSRADFPSSAPVMIITDGWCEERLIVPRDHCFVMPRKQYSEGNARPLQTDAPVFRVLKEER